MLFHFLVIYLIQLKYIVNLFCSEVKIVKTSKGITARTIRKLPSLNASRNNVPSYLQEIHIVFIYYNNNILLCKHFWRICFFMIITIKQIAGHEHTFRPYDVNYFITNWRVSYMIEFFSMFFWKCFLFLDFILYYHNHNML